MKRSSKGGNVPPADDPYWHGFIYRSVNGYKDTELVADLIQRGEIPEFPDPLGSSDYFMLEDEEVSKAIYDPHAVLVNIDMDLRFEDSFLVDRFKKMLTSLRGRGETRAESQHHFPAGTGLDAGLRWLALARIWMATENVAGIHAFIADEDLDDQVVSVIYDSWRSVEEWINNPPVVPSGKKSIRDRGHLERKSTRPSGSAS